MSQKILQITASSLLCLLGGCSNHQVSPWGERGTLSLAPYLARPDLDAQLRAVASETADLGLTLTVELRSELPRGGGEIVVRGYRGEDIMGRSTHAVRVATARGVVLAAGPLDPRDADRARATELVEALLPSDEGGGAWRSGADLNDDGRVDVVLRDEHGGLEIWGVGEVGSGPYEVRLEVSPTGAVDVDGDGLPDLAGRVPSGTYAGPVRPVLDDVATFDGARYVNDSEAALTYHRERVVELEARLAPPPAEDPSSPKPAPPSPELQLSRALELAWHALLAGRPRIEVLKRLDQTTVPASLREPFDHYRPVIARLQIHRPRWESSAARTPDEK